MAYNFTKVWLGFEDEFISEKHKAGINFTTNKIGGKPVSTASVENVRISILYSYPIAFQEIDWPSNKNLDNLTCMLCQLPVPLVLQIYAPLEGSPYHRTLYLFACVNPNCWGQAESWTCIRAQTLEQTVELVDTSTIRSQRSVKEWCEVAEEWDDNNANINEENGNVVSNVERISDDDDESCSTEESIRIGLGGLRVDDRNANMGMAAEAQGGAEGRLHSPRATAEIEGNEGEVISIDTPTLPQHNLAALLQEVTPLPHDICHRTESDLVKLPALEFVSCFMSVWEETKNSSSNIDRHVKELLVEYQQKNDITNEDIDSGCSGPEEENYEKSVPAHGDKMFHYFLTKIQNNPGQLVRYGRDGASPLLLHPLTELSKKCEYCGGEMIFEFQVLPTLIPKLRLNCDVSEGVRLEFGTALIFTCRKSCWSPDTSLRKEVIVLQNET